MLDRLESAKLGKVCCVLLLMVCLSAAVMVACGSPTTSSPQPASASPTAASPTEVVPTPTTPAPTPTDAGPTPTDAVQATIPVQSEAAALVGMWAEDENFVLELADTGVYTLTYSRREPETGTWSLQEDGSLDLEGQSGVILPHGNLLLFDAPSLGAIVQILHRVGEDGSLLAYEPANAVAAPAIEASTTRAITILDSWVGFSPLAPIEAFYRLEPTADGFSGMADFSVAAYTEAMTRSVPISVPLAVVEEFLTLLESTPLEVGEYRPLFNHTDDFPSITIAVEGDDGDLEFSSVSQGSRHIPWRVVAGRKDYITYADTVAQALDLIDPYLARDVQDELFNLALEREQ